MKPENVITIEIDHGMTTEENLIYICCRLGKIMPGFIKLFNDAVIVRDPKYNDLSKPGFALIYNRANNAVIHAKIDNKWQIDYDTAREIEVDGVKSVATFLDFICPLNKYCKKYDYDYRTALLSKGQQIKEDDIVCMESPYNSNQEITYYKTKKIICFKENNEIIKVFNNMHIDFDYLNETDITTFAKESFEFCEENEYSFADYAKEIALNILQLKSVINNFCDRHNSREKLLYTSFDKDGKTAFMYHNNRIEYFKISEDDAIGGVIPDDTGSIKNIKTFEEFKEFIKINRESIDDTINKNVESTKKRLKTSEVEEYENYKDALDNFADHDKEIEK